MSSGTRGTTEPRLRLLSWVGTVYHCCDDVVAVTPVPAQLNTRRDDDVAESIAGRGNDTG